MSKIKGGVENQRNNNVFSLNETLLWITVLAMTALSVWADRKFGVVFFFLVIIILVNGNAKRIYSVKFHGAVLFLRRSCYVFPLFLPLLLPGFGLSAISDLRFLPLGLIGGILFLAPKQKEYRLMLSRDFIIMGGGPKTKTDGFTSIYMQAGAAAGEEVFFRGFIIGYLYVNGSLAFSLFLVALSSILFFMNHFGLKWGASFSLYDCVIQIAFGAVSGALFIFSGSILPGVIMHLIYNSPHIVLEVKKMYTVFDGQRGD